MMVSKGDEQFISSETEPLIYSASSNFLNRFVEQGAAYKMDVDIQNQDETVQAAQKKFDKLHDDEISLMKKIKDLEEDLRTNRQQQENQLKLIDVEKNKLEELRAKKTPAQ